MLMKTVSEHFLEQVTGVPIYKMKSDVHIVQTQKGVYIHNSYGNYFIQGRNVYSLCLWLKEKLNGQYSLKEILQLAPEHLSKALLKIIISFVNNGCTNALTREKTLMDESVKERNHDKINFLEENHPYPIKTFKELTERAWRCKSADFMKDSLISSLSLYAISSYTLETIDLKSNTFKYPKIVEVASGSFSVSVFDFPQSIIITTLNEAAFSFDSGVEADVLPLTFVCKNVVTHVLSHLLLLDTMQETKGEKNSDIIKIHKKNLNVTHHRRNDFDDPYSYKFMPYEPNGFSCGFNLIRQDIPVAINETNELENLERINDTILCLVDSVTGPILEISEQSFDQIPLSILKCHVLGYKQSTPCKTEIKCKGISARETRNQLVLYAVERFINEFIDKNQISQSESPLKFIPKGELLTWGVGWSDFEAIYRSIYAFFSKEVKKGNFNGKKRISLIKNVKTENQQLIEYFLKFNKRHATIDSQLTGVSLGNNLNLVYFSEDQVRIDLSGMNEINYALGITFENAVLNLLQNSIIESDALEMLDNMHSALLWSEVKLTDAEMFVHEFLEKYSFYKVSLERNVSMEVKNNLSVFMMREKGNEKFS